jgi:hypothetical protein
MGIRKRYTRGEMLILEDDKKHKEIVTVYMQQLAPAKNSFIPSDSSIFMCNKEDDEIVNLVGITSLNGVTFGPGRTPGYITMSLDATVKRENANDNKIYIYESELKQILDGTPYKLKSRVSDRITPQVIESIILNTNEKVR